MTAVLHTPDASARDRNPKKIAAGLKAVCPKIIKLNPNKTFWKNNKPKRAGSAINAPVIGYYKQMTLANNAGVRNVLGSSAVNLYDSKGSVLTRMTPYACRDDHCGGRVVSVAQTDTTRRIAIARTKSPSGFVKLTKTICVEIEDIGRCYGDEVDKTRALCNQTVG